MFESLTQRLSGTIERLRGRGRLTESNITEAVREVRIALLEADVALPVVQALVQRIKVRAVGQEVMRSLTPGQVLVRIVRDELTAVMGSQASDLNLKHGPARQPEPLDWRLLLHAWLALLAYATLAIAAVLAVFLWLQERALRRREFHRWLRALPPLTELETLLFRTIMAGFVLLGAVLLTGVLFVDDLLAQHLVHKTVLSVMSWLAFGALLVGRWRLGWRGATAVRWTLVAMALLLLAFFGSKFVLELVLARG